MTAEACSHGVARLLCGDVQWWEATLICLSALVVGAVLMQLVMWLLRR
jgi:endonuclease III-like uncharacterized protein